MMPVERVTNRPLVRGPVYHCWWDRFVFSRRQHMHPCALDCRTESGAPVLVICTTPTGESTCGILEMRSLVVCEQHEDVPFR